MLRPPLEYTKPSLSSLPLQMLIYYNLLFSLIYLVLLGAGAIQKINSFNNFAQLIVLVVWIFTEPIRLYYGFTGNLKESVPHLSTYLLMTVFPQLPMVIYLAYFQVLRLPIDAVVGSLMVIFLALQFYFGVTTIRTVMKNQTAQFMQLVEHED
mmetsp:Transcript_5279/g.5778  ORF Transcript_5279/g.5778 Transcript_5279/m.5778 type:complete len:153 (+) Transcript_5279:74-532(+)